LHAQKRKGEGALDFSGKKGRGGCKRERKGRGGENSDVKWPASLRGGKEKKGGERKKRKKGRTYSSPREREKKGKGEEKKKKKKFRHTFALENLFHVFNQRPVRLRQRKKKEKGSRKSPKKKREKRRFGLLHPFPGGKGWAAGERKPTGRWGKVALGTCTLGKERTNVKN